MNTEKKIPLSELLRPQKIEDVIGQAHLLERGQSLRVAIESGNLPSMILWGPPGVGKTTIARVVANTNDAQFISLSAVLSGVKEIRESIEKAEFARDQHDKNTILLHATFDLDQELFQDNLDLEEIESESDVNTSDEKTSNEK